MLSKKQTWSLLISILILAAFLRLYNLTSADVITDEALIAFRAIGYIDFFVSPYQTTPYEWFSDTPAWVKLSFHDHPPLIFLIENLFFKVFGVNVFSLRLPFVLAVMASVILIYLIGSQLFNQKSGLLAALFLAISPYHLWISRVGLHESMVMALMLLAFYFFILSLGNQKHWRWGIFLGLAMLSKYTAIILLPIFLVYLLISNRKILFDKKFWLAIILVILIFSPVLIYNFKLYQARGHFDLQLSFLFGQKVNEWQFLPGKIQAGSLFDRIINLIPAMFRGLLAPMFLLFAISLLSVVYQLIKETLQLAPSWQSGGARSEPLIAPPLVVLAIIFHILLFMLIGPLSRFVVMIIPFSLLLIVWILPQQPKKIMMTLVNLITFSELFFSYNTLYAFTPIGQKDFTYAYFRNDSVNWGYNQLDDYLTEIFKNKRPAVSFTGRYPFLEKIKQQATATAKKENKQPVFYF